MLLFSSLIKVHYLLVAFHWNSCIFFKIHKGSGFGAGNNSLFGQVGLNTRKDDETWNTFQEFPDLAKEKSEMERVVELGTGESDRTLANQIARSDITKLYLMSEFWLFVAVIF